MILDEADYATHMEYIHYNPVKHGWVHSLKDWPYSSFDRLAEAGVYSFDWAGDIPESLAVGEMDNE